VGSQWRCGTQLGAVVGGSASRRGDMRSATRERGRFQIGSRPRTGRRRYESRIAPDLRVSNGSGSFVPTLDSTPTPGPILADVPRTDGEVGPLRTGGSPPPGGSWRDRARRPHPAEHDFPAHRAAAPGRRSHRPPDRAVSSSSTVVDGPVGNSCARAPHTTSTSSSGSSSGPSNRFAHAAAFAVAEAPAKAYNPLFIYGAPDWARPTCSRPSATTPDACTRGTKITYVTSEQFTSEFIEGVRPAGRGLPAPLPRDRHPAHRRHPVPREGERTQEEFFHTFNALHHAEKQIVLTSDRPPRSSSGSRSGCAPASRWASSPTSSHPTSRPGWPSCAARPTWTASASPMTSSSSSPGASRPTSASSRAR
jgi:hypothetical protein